jgi:hypothetical protein
MAGPTKRVAVLDPDGNFGTIDESEVDQLPDGARVLSSKELAQRAVDERYEALPAAQKALGAVNTVVGAVNPLTFGADPAAPPTVAAYGAGVREGATAGLYDAGMRKLVDAVGGKEKGAAYAQQRDEEKEASPIASGVGNVMGMVGGAALGTPGAGAARALPSAALGTAGNALEHGLTQALRGVAARGALGRAAATGASMAVRGAVEGAAYAGIEQAASDVVHDTPTTGEKLYAAMGHGALAGGGLGGALGFTGSLAASGYRGLASRVGAKLERGAAQAEAASMLHEAPRGEAVHGAAEAPAPAGGRAKTSVLDLLTDPNNTARALAQEQAWDAIGRGYGLQSTRFAKLVERAGGKAAHGETGFKYGLIDMGAPNASPFQAAVAAAKSGTAADILPKAEMALEQVGRQIGEITDASGARVSREQVQSAIDKVAGKYESAAATRPAGRSIRAFGEDLVDSMGLRAEGSTASIQDAIRERKAIDRISFRDAATLDPKTALEAKRELRWQLEDLITEAMDGASGKVPGQLRAQYKALKTDYQRLSNWAEAAEDSAARASKAATFGLSEKLAMAGSIASGNLSAAPILAVGGKVLKERGNAALAGFLSRAADQGTFAELVGQFDRRISKAAAGALRDANDGSPRSVQRARTAAPSQRQRPETGRAQVEDTQKKARDIVRWVGEHRANPKAIQAQLEEASALVGRTAGPKAAEGYTAMTLRAIGFVASYVPVKERRDPLDPKSVPPLTFEEADRLVRAATYAARPETIFDDFERGKVTPEGLRAAKTFAPESFAQFQSELQRHVEDHLLRNKRLTDSQRLRIDKLLGFPAGADLKPAAIARLQGNLAMKALAEPPPADPTGGGAPPPPVNMRIQQSGFDAIEARVAG